MFSNIRISIRQRGNSEKIIICSLFLKVLSISMLNTVVDFLNRYFPNKCAKYVLPNVVDLNDAERRNIGWKTEMNVPLPFYNYLTNVATLKVKKSVNQQKVNFLNIVIANAVVFRRLEYGKEDFFEMVNVLQIYCHRKYFLGLRSGDCPVVHNYQILP